MMARADLDGGAVSEDEQLHTEVSVTADVVFLRACGTTSLADMKHMFQVCQKVYDEYGYALILGDNTNAGKSTPAARKHQTDMLRKKIFPSHTVIFGGNLISRTTVLLVSRAVELVTGTKIPVDMVNDEATARRLLDQARERFHSQGLAKK